MHVPIHETYYADEACVRRNCYVCGHPSHLARHCKHWFKQQLDIQKQLSQLKKRALNSSDSGADQADNEASEMDVRSKEKRLKKKKKPFWKKKKSQTELDNEKLSKKAKIQCVSNLVFTKESKCPKGFKRKGPILVWVPKCCSSKTSPSLGQRFHGGKIKFGDFTVTLPGTIMSRKPMSN